MYQAPIVFEYLLSNISLVVAQTLGTEMQSTSRYLNFSICRRPPYNIILGLSSLLKESTCCCGLYDTVYVLFSFELNNSTLVLSMFIIQELLPR